MTLTDSEETRQILQQRARQLAQRRDQHQQRQVLVDAIVVDRSDIHLGFPIDAASEVRRVSITSIPGAHPPVEGLFQVRGQGHLLFDLHTLFFGDSDSLDHGDTTLALIIEQGGRTLGLRIDQIIGSRTVYRDELHQEETEKKLPFVSHITGDVLNLIDLNRLVRHLDTSAR